MTGKTPAVSMARLMTSAPRDGVSVFERAGQLADGRVVRLKMGPFRPYLVTHPDHVQRVFRERQPYYVRGGMFWDPLEPLLGKGILSDGPEWADSRKILQPLFTARHVNSLAERMAQILDELVASTLQSDVPFDIVDGISRIVHPTIVRLFFGDKLTRADMDRLLPAYNVGVTARAARLMLPFVPQWFPLWGDRAFKRAIADIDQVIYRRIAATRAEPESDGQEDVLTRLWRAYEQAAPAGSDGQTDQWIRDNLVSMHGASTETSSTALCWIWPILQEHPQVAEQVYAEIDRVVGDGPVTTAHLPELRYLHQVVQELLRLYPPGWVLPRLAVEDDELGGVPIKAGSTVIVSPYLSHRLPEFWSRPTEFDPDRFSEEQTGKRHRYAYFPFAGGPHQCLGMHLFMMEAQLLIATVLRRYRPQVHTSGPIRPQMAFSLRPPAGLTMTLIPRHGGSP
ncbi:cytochrome P450 [Nonomuraea sp. NBC_01738]|uniref:cytochrome P450 n=1 Tax=Nonomuraea sp. NBC_01738 TaxID=2976003 RepID=UPI002E12DB20|nr:cytochrome P450 [Nonomuraea sp. NBC_01738]